MISTQKCNIGWMSTYYNTNIKNKLTPPNGENVFPKQQGIYTFKQHSQVNSCVKEDKNHLVSFQKVTWGVWKINYFVIRTNFEVQCYWADLFQRRINKGKNNFLLLITRKKAKNKNIFKDKITGVPWTLKKHVFT